jgi:hypothetical protein
MAIGAVLSIGHVITTARAASTLLRLRKGILPEKELSDVYQRFATWSGARSVLQVSTFIVVILATVSAS